MGLNDLPKPGGKFSTNVGPGSFARKFGAATGSGELKNLRDNKDVLIKTIKKYQQSIKREGLTEQQRRNALSQMQHDDKSLTYDDKQDIKKILRHLGKGCSTVNKDETAALETVSGHKKVRPIHRALDTSGLETIARGSVGFGLSKKEKGTAANTLGIKGPEYGISALQKKPLSNTPPPAKPAGSFHPIIGLGGLRK